MSCHTLVTLRGHASVNLSTHRLPLQSPLENSTYTKKLPETGTLAHTFPSILETVLQWILSVTICFALPAQYLVELDCTEIWSLCVQGLSWTYAEYEEPNVHEQVLPHQLGEFLPLLLKTLSKNSCQQGHHQEANN